MHLQTTSAIYYILHIQKTNKSILFKYINHVIILVVLVKMKPKHTVKL